MSFQSCLPASASICHAWETRRLLYIHYTGSHVARATIQQNQKLNVVLLLIVNILKCLRDSNVVYWPTTRSGCQNRKCTYVNNRCIRSRNIRIITLTVDGLNECNCDAHKKKAGVELLYNWVHRKFNQFGDQTSWRQDAVEKARTQQRGPSGPRLISLETRPVRYKMR